MDNMLHICIASVRRKGSLGLWANTQFHFYAPKKSSSTELFDRAWKQIDKEGFELHSIVRMKMWDTHKGKWDNNVYIDEAMGL